MYRTFLAMCVVAAALVYMSDTLVRAVDASQDDTRSETPVFDLDVKGRYGNAPAEVTVVVTMKRAADNRAVRLEIDSANFYRASYLQIDGDRAPERQPVIWKGVPAGEYRIFGELVDLAGEVKSKAWQEIQIF